MPWCEILWKMTFIVKPAPNWMWSDGVWMRQFLRASIQINNACNIIHGASFLFIKSGWAATPRSFRRLHSTVVLRFPESIPLHTHHVWPNSSLVSVLLKLRVSPVMLNACFCINHHLLQVSMYKLTVKRTDRSNIVLRTHIRTIMYWHSVVFPLQ